MCLSACPFYNQKKNETSLAAQKFGDQQGIHYNSVVGLFLNLFAGYSKIDDHRKNGAGGGVTTWLLEKLLINGIVDKVVCVQRGNGDANLFHFSIFNSVQDIRRASRSTYYPVELSAVISKILCTEYRYAVVGLPCALKGLNLAMLKNRALNKRVVIMLGLICGQLKSKFFAEYLCAMAAGESPQSLLGHLLE